MINLVQYYIYTQDLQALQKLIKNGEKVTGALLLDAIYRNSEIAELLVNNIPASDINYKDPRNDQSLLVCALRKKMPTVAETLWQRGAVLPVDLLKEVIVLYLDSYNSKNDKKLLQYTQFVKKIMEGGIKPDAEALTCLFLNLDKFSDEFISIIMDPLLLEKVNLEEFNKNTSYSGSVLFFALQKIIHYSNSSDYNPNKYIISFVKQLLLRGISLDEFSRHSLNQINSGTYGEYYRSFIENEFMFCNIVESIKTNSIALEHLEKFFKLPENFYFECLTNIYENKITTLTPKELKKLKCFIEISLNKLPYSEKLTSIYRKITEEKVTQKDPTAIVLIKKIETNKTSRLAEAQWYRNVMLDFADSNEKNQVEKTFTLGKLSKVSPELYEKAQLKADCLENILIITINYNDSHFKEMIEDLCRKQPMPKYEALYVIGKTLYEYALYLKNNNDPFGIQEHIVQNAKLCLMENKTHTPSIELLKKFSVFEKTRHQFSLTSDRLQGARSSDDLLGEQSATRPQSYNF